MNYKGGITLKKYFCSCGNPITVDTFLYGCKKCISCAKRGRKIKDATKRKISKSLKGRLRPEISKLMTGKNNHQYRGRENYCDDCGTWLDNRNVNKCWKCYQKTNIGENSPNWQGGFSLQKYPREFSKDLKYTIRLRDNFTCQNCKMTEEEHLIKINQVLHIHHIDYDKENLDENNLITLCLWCNIKANKNKEFWLDFYKKKVILVS
ncbi:MAG: HNH endonuclease [Promethearchaeota archaeon]